ncbi:MAG: class I SAM-dependent methyltransferase [Candidatus Tagabacteria bacterium]
MLNQDKLNKEIEAWWDKNPFAFGVSNTKRDQVGTIGLAQMNLAYFQEIERKFRKHTRGGAQEDGKSLFSKLIDYRWLKGKKVLDIAVGSGFSMVVFLEGGAEVTGIDISNFAVNFAKKNLECRNLSGEVLKMDAQNMQFPDESFDFVNAWGCLMHMPDTEKAIREMYRVLKPGGRAFAYMYNKNSWPYWFNAIFLRGIFFGQLLRYRFNTVKLTSRYSDGYSVGGNALAKFYVPDKVRQMFREAGFKNVECFPFELPDEPNQWPARRFPIFKYLPARIKSYMAKRWGYGLIVRAEK